MQNRFRHFHQNTLEFDLMVAIRTIFYTKCVLISLNTPFGRELKLNYKCIKINYKLYQLNCIS